MFCVKDLMNIYDIIHKPYKIPDSRTKYISSICLKHNHQKLPKEPDSLTFLGPLPSSICTATLAYQVLLVGITQAFLGSFDGSDHDPMHTCKTSIR